MKGTIGGRLLLLSRHETAYAAFFEDPRSRSVVLHDLSNQVISHSRQFGDPPVSGPITRLRAARATFKLSWTSHHT